MFKKSRSLNSLEKAIQKTKTTTMVKKSRSLNNLEKAIQQRIATLKKSASQLEILCGAQVCCIWEGPNGNLEVWPENAADAVSAITKYKNCKKKTKVCREVNRSNNVERCEVNKGLTLGDDDKGFDNVILSNSLEIFADENKVSDTSYDTDQFIMNNTMETVEPNKGFDMGGEKLNIFDMDQRLNFEENTGFNHKRYSFGDDGLNKYLSGEPLRDASTDFLGSKLDRAYQRIESVEGDDHDQNKYHVLNNGSDPVPVENDNDLSDHDFNQLWDDDILGDTADLKEGGFPGCSSSINADHTSTAPWFEDEIENLCGVSLWPWSYYG